MKLLFDENLSRKLPSRLAADLPGCTHVDAVRLGSRSDTSIWEHARANGYTIVSKANKPVGRANPTSTSPPPEAQTPNSPSDTTPPKPPHPPLP